MTAHGRPDRVVDEAWDGLRGLGPETVVLIGEPAALRFDELGRGFETERLAGADRYETAAVIARRRRSAKTVFVATGLDFPDALAGGPVAAAARHPILLVSDEVPPATKGALADLGVQDVIVLGGTDAVSAAVEEELAVITGDENVVRLAGSNRFETAVAIAEYAATELAFDFGTVLLANGVDNFGIDALTGGQLGGQLRAPMLLVDGSSVPDATAAFLNQQADSIDVIHAIGGEAAISSANLDAAAAAATPSQRTLDLPLSWGHELVANDEGVSFHQGEPGAVGSATITLDGNTDLLTYRVDYSDVTGPFGDAAAIHIHRGRHDGNGPIVLFLASGAEAAADDDQVIQGTITTGNATADGSGTDDVDLPALLDELLRDPHGFYVNVHSNFYPAGAVRGQLSTRGVASVVPPVVTPDEGETLTLAESNGVESDHRQYFANGLDVETEYRVSLFAADAVGGHIRTSPSPTRMVTASRTSVMRRPTSRVFPILRSSLTACVASGDSPFPTGSRRTQSHLPSTERTLGP